ncbi:MAG: tetratricopeptide repeat protein [Pseudomonadota bacterium]
MTSQNKPESEAVNQSESPQPKTPEAKPSPPYARIALIGAALIAVAAIGLSLRGTGDQTAASVAAQMPSGDVNTAIAELEAKLKDNPKDAQGWQMLGWALMQTQKFAEASQAYARATQLDPGKADYWSSLGEARVLAGPGDVPADAKTAFDKAIALDPKDPRARYFTAVAQDIAGDHKGAIDGWLSLLADTPSGAPWEADVRRLIAEVGAKEKIEVASRLAAIRPAQPKGGAAVATAGIPGPSREQMQAGAQLPKGQQEAMIAGMVDGLEAKLKANPKNESGWIMLMRSRIQLGEEAKSTTALKNARAAYADDSAALKRLNEAAAELGIRG